eukprot:COSAG01_NODE_1471_length_10198_cov_4.595703_2_plen_586_part_00
MVALFAVPVTTAADTASAVGPCLSSLMPRVVPQPQPAARITALAEVPSDAASAAAAATAAAATTMPAASTGEEEQRARAEKWERYYHGSPGTGEVCAVSMFGAVDPATPDVASPWKTFCEMGGTKDAPAALAIAAMYDADYGGAYTEFWTSYTDLLRKYATDKKFLVAITMESGYIGHIQKEEVKFISKCRGDKLRVGSIDSYVRPDLQKAHKLAMTFQQFQEWAGSDFAELSLGLGTVPSLRAASAEYRRLLDRDRHVREAEPWERGSFGLRSGGTSRCVLPPSHKFRKIWDLIQILMLLYVAVLIPQRIGFDIDLELLTWKWFIELIVDTYFIADIFVNFRTGVMIDNELEMSARRIAIHYAKGWLLVDVVSCLPIGYVSQAMNESGQTPATSNTKAFKILRMLRLSKLLRLARLKQILKRHEEELEDIMTIVNTSMAFVIVGYVCHVFACGWYYVGKDDDLAVDDQSQFGWISRLWNVTVDSHTDIDFSTRYATAYYWAVSTLSTMGASDVTPATTSERWFSSVTQLLSILMGALLTGALSSAMVGHKLLVRSYLCVLQYGHMPPLTCSLAASGAKSQHTNL